MKKKSIIKRIFLVIGITFGVLCALVIAFFIWIIATMPKENASDVEWSFSYSLSITPNGSMSEGDFQMH
jgi:hypothetical protein